MILHPAASLLLVVAVLGAAAGAEAGSFRLSARSALTDPVSGSVQQNASDRVGPNPIFPGPLQAQGTATSRGAEVSHLGFADFGVLKARPAQSLGGSSPPSPRADGAVKVYFDDSITITGGSGTGTFKAIFTLEGAVEVGVSATASAASADGGYDFRLRVADGVFAWSSSAEDVRPGTRTTAAQASLTVGGSPMTPPAAHPPGTYTTPALSFTYGVPFTIAGELGARVSGQVDEGTTADASALVDVRFLWGGMTDLDPGADLVSTSGRDYRQSFTPAAKP